MKSISNRTLPNNLLSKCSLWDYHKSLKRELTCIKKSAHVPTQNITSLARCTLSTQSIDKSIYDLIRLPIMKWSIKLWIPVRLISNPIHKIINIHSPLIPNVIELWKYYLKGLLPTTHCDKTAPSYHPLPLRKICFINSTHAFLILLQKTDPIWISGNWSHPSCSCSCFPI